MPTLHFLTDPSPLSQQVAQFLADMKAEVTLLVAPTAGAARRIGHWIETSGGKPPPTAQPMQALLPSRDDIATPVERCLAWAEALKHLHPSQLQTLFWKERPESTAELLKAGRNFNHLCDQLAEAGLDPASLQWPATPQGSFDEGRWAAITTLHRLYLERLQDWSLRDPNDLRLEQIQAPASQIQGLVIAGVADLPHAFQRYAQQLEQSGSRVDVLVWNPGQASPESFDPWGRPLPAIWNECLIDLEEAQIHVAASSQDEARAAVAKTVRTRSALVCTDPKLHSLLACEISSHGHEAYRPDGDALIACQAAKLALGWEAFRQSQDLRELRSLLELPAFCRALDTDRPLSQTVALTAIDHLLGKTIASTLDAAWLASPALATDAPTGHNQLRPTIRRLLGTVRARLNTSALELLANAFPDNDTARPASAKQVIDIGRRLESSPALKEWSEGARGQHLPVQILAQALRAERLQTPATADAITLNGWLEAPWLSEDRLVLCGLCEGQLPQTFDGDPFLPDSIRPALGLSHNAQRLARDAYLLASLAAAHPGDCLQLSYSKYNNEGDPNKPSRLLLRTALDQLPARVRHLTQAGASARPRPRRQTAWRWQLPGELPLVKKISPTQFEAYLACPFRFCLEKVMGYERAPEASHEMDASVFGNLIHKTLEKFGRELIPTGKAMLRLNESGIRQRTGQLLEQEAHAQFGAQPAPAVRIQLASAAARLQAFSRVQAECFAGGWQILDVERKLDAESTQALSIGPLQLSGIIDRIEQQVDTGLLRVLDYKTFSSLQKPVQTHFAPASHNWLPAAQIELQSVTGNPQKTWKNLQLPLYRKILEHWYPGECATLSPQTAYFVLPSDPNESGIYAFEELSDETYHSALECAEAVTRHIADGVFWPPQPFRGTWDDPFAPLFVNGPPEHCVAPATIQLLKGGFR